MVVWFELTCPRRWLTSLPSCRQSHRITVEECGCRSGVTACTAWPMVYGHPMAAVRTFRRQAWSLSSPTAWAACGLATPRASLRFWMATMCRSLVPQRRHPCGEHHRDLWTRVVNLDRRGVWVTAVRPRTLPYPPSDG